MKKIYMMLVLALVCAILPMSTIAQAPQLAIESVNDEVVLDIINGTKTKSVDSVLKGIMDCEEAVTTEMKINTDVKASVSLRLVIYGNTAVDNNPLNDYEITVTDKAGSVVYDSKEAEAVKVSDTYKEIPIGEFMAGDNKSFDVTYKHVGDEVVGRVSFEVAVKSDSVPASTPKPTPEPTKKPTATPKPKFDFDSLNDKGNGFVLDLAEENSASSGNAVKEIVKVCGKDIPEGRFSVSGNGNLKITSSTGNVKASYVVADTPTGAASVKSAVVLLEKGDVITITPISGEAKARLKFDKIATDASGTTPTPVNPADANKTNPKTSDSGMGIAIAVAALAVIAVAVLEVLKRKKNN